MKNLHCSIFACAVLAVLWCVVLTSTETLAQNQTWLQWGQNPQHTGAVDVAGQDLNRIISDIIYDPFVPQEQAFTGGELLVHYQVPLLEGQDVFMAFKTGSYPIDQPDPTQFEVFHQKRLQWEAGQLVEKWDFQSGWKPLPTNLVGGWEPVYHAILANGHVYDVNFGGTISKINRGDGREVVRIKPFGGPPFDPNKFVAGPISADGNGNLYYNVLQINPTTLRTTDSWLVKVAPDNSTTKVRYTDLLAPVNPPTTCFGQFTNATLPWPPSPTAVPPTFPCGSQRPGVNVAPAIAPDGTIYTVSRADRNSRYSYLVAVNPDLSLKWAASLRDRIADGCGNGPGFTVPIASSPTPERGKCRFGANVGVDPQTNQMPAGRVIDQSSSSPTVLPDGSVLYGAYSRYNVARGHLFKFSSQGDFLAAFDFGWDSTPAVFSHDGTFSIIIKDNHYDEEIGFYCNPSGPPGSIPRIVCDSTGIPAGPFYITQLNANLLPEWKFHSIETQSCTRQPDGSLSCVSDHPNGFEWCINAPAVDRNGVVYVESEDGNAYRIPQGQTGVFDISTPGAGVTRLFMQLALGAAYTPLSIGSDGKIYTQNSGHLFVLGN